MWRLVVRDYVLPNVVWNAPLERLQQYPKTFDRNLLRTSDFPPFNRVRRQGEVRDQRNALDWGEQPNVNQRSARTFELNSDLIRYIHYSILYSIRHLKTILNQIKSLFK